MNTRISRHGANERHAITDDVFDFLYNQIVSTRLEPGHKISEAEIAAKFKISRQPVRDAFFRLSQLGFLRIQPQRASEVSLISTKVIERACFLRTSIEVEVIILASNELSVRNIMRLSEHLEEQQNAIDASDADKFNALDDNFHQAICDMIERPYAWEAIRDLKVHMDRVRFLSHAFALQTAIEDHKDIVNALRVRDTRRAIRTVRRHLGRTHGIIGRLKSECHDWFTDDNTESPFGGFIKP